ncbi:cupin domain-containing protein [Lacunisphaera limnophila]|nr:cupin domain-containing protein [Lacunisphaera limnophila]
MFTPAHPSGYREPFTGVRFKTLVHGQHTLFAEFRLARGHPLPRHAHPHEQTGYLVSGHLRLTIGTDTFDVRPGDSWCIPGNVEHEAAILEDSVAIEVFSPVREDYLPPPAAAV